MRGPTQYMAPIGSAVLTFIGYKRTDKQKINLDNVIDIIDFRWVGI